MQEIIRNCCKLWLFCPLSISIYLTWCFACPHTRARTHILYFICCGDTQVSRWCANKMLSTVWKCCLLLLCHQFYLFMNIGGRRILQWIVVYANLTDRTMKSSNGTGGNGNVTDRNQVKSKMRNAITSRIVSNEKFVRFSFHWHCVSVAAKAMYFRWIIEKYWRRQRCWRYDFAHFYVRVDTHS